MFWEIKKELMLIMKIVGSYRMMFRSVSKVI